MSNTTNYIHVPLKALLCTINATALANVAGATCNFRVYVSVLCSLRPNMRLALPSIEMVHEKSEKHTYTMTLSVRMIQSNTVAESQQYHRYQHP